jgi:hypothetical protein
VLVLADDEGVDAVADGVVVLVVGEAVVDLLADEDDDDVVDAELLAT